MQKRTDTGGCGPLPAASSQVMYRCIGTLCNTGTISTKMGIDSIPNLKHTQVACEVNDCIHVVL